MFGRDAFLRGEHGETFHELARREGLQWEARVARDLFLADQIKMVTFLIPDFGQGQADDIRDKTNAPSARTAQQGGAASAILDWWSAP